MTEVCFDVNITDDERHELPENFNIVVTTDDDQINIPRPETPFNIEDDDGELTQSILTAILNSYKK